MSWTSDLCAAAGMLVLLAAAPAHGSSPPGAPRGEWVAVEIAGRALGNDRTRFALGAERVTGSSGCNRFNGTVTLGPGDAVSFGPAAATKMACPPELMGQERAFFDALNAARSWRAETGGVAVLDASGATVLRLRQGP